jgi:hypothetical protein
MIVEKTQLELSENRAPRWSIFSPNVLFRSLIPLIPKFSLRGQPFWLRPQPCLWKIGSILWHQRILLRLQWQIAFWSPGWTMHWGISV